MTILVFPGLPVLDLGPMYSTDRQSPDVRHASSLNASVLWGDGVGIMMERLLWKLQVSFKLGARVKEAVE